MEQITPADPLGSPAKEEAKRRGLRKMKLVALSFLLGATVIFVLTSLAEAAGWSG